MNQGEIKMECPKCKTEMKVINGRTVEVFDGNVLSKYRIITHACKNCSNDQTYTEKIEVTEE